MQKNPGKMNRVNFQDDLLMPNPTQHRLLSMSELPRAGLELASLAASAPWLSLSPRGDKHPVVVIPGFLASDDSTALLRRYLTFLGYDTYTWGQGRNLGISKMGGYEPLVNHVLRIYRNTGRTVSLVGWSLGGVHALAVADRAGYAVRQLVTLGSPIRTEGPTTAMFTALRSAARQLNGELLNTPTIPSFGLRHGLQNVSAKIPVTAIYSRTDGVVHWRRAHVEESERRQNIEVHSSHIGLGIHPAVLYAVADRLALEEASFTPFHRQGWRALTYPKAVSGQVDQTK
jgi:pimeloyl-ACP methyl ester carboxylesterase